MFNRNGGTIAGGVLILILAISCSFQQKDDPVSMEGYWKVIPLDIVGSDDNTWMLWKFDSDSKIYTLASRRIGKYILGDTLSVLTWQLSNSNYDIKISASNSDNSDKLVYSITNDGDDLLFKMHEELRRENFFNDLRLEKYKGKVR